jgi:hypothetical protein
MASGARKNTTSAAAGPVRPELRLQLKPEAPGTGYVDGAWWPRSQDLATELPPLLAGLTARLGRVERVTHNFTAWSPAPRRLAGEGGGVRIEGFRTQHTATVTLIGARRQLTLLVVPPGTDPEVARRTLTTAAHAGNTDTLTTLLATGEEPGRSAPEPAGHLPVPA